MFRLPALCKLALGLALLLARPGAGWTQYASNFDALVDGASILTGIDNAGSWAGLAGATAVASNGTYTYSGSTFSNCVIFQGEISNLFATITPDTTNFNVSVQMLAQIQWSDSMPDPSVCPTRQGGVCFSNGYVYAWGSNTWLQLANTNDARQTVNSNTWTRLNFLANYSDNTASTVYYKVFVDATNFVPADSGQRYALAGRTFSKDTAGTYVQSSALFVGSGGISGLYLAGSGSMDLLDARRGTESATLLGGSAPVVPTSSGIGVNAYQGADGVYVQFMTHSEEGSGQIRVYIMDLSGHLLWAGTNTVVGSGDNLYRFRVPNLAVGSSYHIVVYDEVNQPWDAGNVVVSTFASKMIQMSPVGVTLQFDSIPDRTYEIQWAPRLGAAWTNVMTTTALSNRTSAFIFFKDALSPSAGFFRIVQTME